MMAHTATIHTPFHTSTFHQGPIAAPGGLRAHYAAADLASQIFKSKSPMAKTHRADEDDDDNILAGTAERRVERPDITFRPSWTNFQDRAARLREEREKSPRQANDRIPDGFPVSIQKPWLWSGCDTAQGPAVKVDDFVVALEDFEIEEIKAALAHFKALPGYTGPDQISKHLFPLPTLGPKLDKFSQEVHSGRGLVVLRGLEPQRYTELENVLLYVGISSHIAQDRGVQDRGGTMLTHIVSRGKKDETSPAYTTAGLPFHTDVCDILALYAIDNAPHGGELLIASSAAVYNEIAASRADVINLLASKVWCYDSERSLLPNWPRRQLLHLEPTYGPIFLFSRRKLTGSSDLPLTADIPVMSEAQAEALDLVHFVAKKHSIKFKMQPGDMLFTNNLAQLHSREAYVETVNNPKKRHLLRLWLRNDQRAWKTPKGLEEDWFNVYGGSHRRSRAFWTISAGEVDMVRFLKQKDTCPT